MSFFFFFKLSFLHIGMSGVKIIRSILVLKEEKI